MAQTATEPLVSFSTRAAMLEVDAVGNIYLAEDYRLTKYAPDGSELAFYEDFVHGPIGLVDASDPMKVLVYFSDQQHVVVLDRTMSVISSFNLMDLGFVNVTAIGNSMDDRFWIFDQSDFLLRKIDKNGTVFKESQVLNVLLDGAVTITRILEREGRIYAHDPDRGVLVFGLFGTYEETLDIDGRGIHYVQGRLVWTDGDQLALIDPETLDVQRIDLPEASGRERLAARIAKQRMVVLFDGRLRVHPLP